jgi:magnesium chelatase family protein
MLEITQLHSLISGKYDELVTSRPFRAPHHSASHIAVVGGGNNIRPGEISLAHRGVLFFDEFPEFGRVTIEALRQPLEDREITVARVKDTATYPANFILVATANPCPCGYYGTTKPCSCSANAILRYRQKLSGPIMDRIDLYVTVQEIEHERLLSASQDDTDTPIRERVLRARDIQAKRYNSPVKLNADMNNRDIRTKARILTEAGELLNSAAKTLELSARSYMRIIKVARTIADLDGSDDILPNHISEALQYRSQNLQTLQ